VPEIMHRGAPDDCLLPPVKLESRHMTFTGAMLNATKIKENIIRHGI
jgi:hypothetical protein